MRLKRIRERIKVIKIEDFLKEIESNLPITAYPTERLCDALRQKEKNLTSETELRITAVSYAGDAGGIVCHLENPALEKSENVYVVSLTHLRIDPAHPLANKLKAYQQQRIKSLRPW